MSPDAPASADSPIHFQGTIPNASGTPRGEVGGLAVFGGVLMISRTGFAVAVRRRGGGIVLRQYPFPRLRWRLRLHGVPLVRGNLVQADMVEVGTEAFRFAGAVLEGLEPEEHGDAPRGIDRGRTTLLLVGSLAALAALVVVLPNLAVAAVGIVAAWMGMAPGGIAFFCDAAVNPIGFHVLAGVIRIGLLVGYVGALGLDPEIREVFAYHGAEHKAVLALEAGRDVTVDRARSQDTIHDRCGTNFLALACVVAGFTFAVGDAVAMGLWPWLAEAPALGRAAGQMALHVGLMPVVFGLSFELLRWASQRPRSHRLAAWMLNPGRWLQRMTTRQPDDLQLEVAIVALFGALAISPREHHCQTWVVRGLEDDESAPGYIARSPARRAEPTPPAPESAVAATDASAPGRTGG